MPRPELLMLYANFVIVFVRKNYDFKKIISLSECLCGQGRKPRGTWGTVPPKFEVGGLPMHASPQYFEK